MSNLDHVTQALGLCVLLVTEDLEQTLALGSASLGCRSFPQSIRYCCSVTQSCLTVTPWTVVSRLFCPWDFTGKNTRVGCHFPLQGIFLTQGACVSCVGRRVLYH